MSRVRVPLLAPFRSFSAPGSQGSIRVARKYMEPQMDADKGPASQVLDDPADRYPRQTEFDQETDAQVGCFQVIQALCPVDLVQRTNSLEFHKDRPFDREVHCVPTNNDAVVSDGSSILLRQR